MRIADGQRIPETHEEFWCYLNTWAERPYGAFRTRQWMRGYEQAVDDIMRRFEAVTGTNNETVPNEIWREWSRALVRDEWSGALAQNLSSEAEA